MTVPWQAVGGTCVAMCKVSLRSPQTTLSKAATRAHSRSIDAPVPAQGGSSTAEMLQREVTTWRLDGNVYPNAAKLSG